jgi:PhnB protein
MEKPLIPEGYQQVMPYLILQNAGDFFDFMEKVFGATEKYKAMRDETRIAHAELQVGESTIMYASSTDQWKTQTAGMFIYVANADETYARALAEGAVSVMQMSDQSYGRTGGVVDPFGNVWWITSPLSQG